MYQMQDCVRDHEEKTLGEVMGQVWGVNWGTQEGLAEDQHDDYEKPVATGKDGKLYCKGFAIAEFLRQQAQRGGNPTRKGHMHGSCSLCRPSGRIHKGPQGSKVLSCI